MKTIKGDWNEKHEEVMEAQTEPFVFINSNGSKWAGQDPDDIDELLRVLAEYKLRPNLAPFVELNPCQGVYNPAFRYDAKEPQYIAGPRLFKADGVVHFSGNFDKLSHVFSIYTNDPDTISRLTAAIKEN